MCTPLHTPLICQLAQTAVYLCPTFLQIGDKCGNSRDMWRRSIHGTSSSREFVLCMDPGSWLLCSDVAVYSLTQTLRWTHTPLEPYATNQTELDKMRYNVRFRKSNFSWYSNMLNSAWCQSRYKLHFYFSKYPSYYPAAKNETQLPASTSTSSWSGLRKPQPLLLGPNKASGSVQ